MSTGYFVNVLDLFSGIGGFSLGLERAGFRTVGFCEIDPYCRRVLAERWPSVPIWEDVKDLSAQHIAARGLSVDVICGGFPCQDVSVAGKGAGLEGKRSGLWSEYARLIGELRPSYVIVENVAALLNRGLDRVLGDLAEIGYDAEWHCIPASAIGAPHRRDRIWIVAHPAGVLGNGGNDNGRGDSKGAAAFSEPRDRGGNEDLADANRHDVQGVFAGFIDQEIGRRSLGGSAGSCGNGIGWWSSEPNVGRVAHGISSRMDRLRGLGNAVVPQIPEIIGRAIMSTKRERSAQF